MWEKGGNGSSTVPLPLLVPLGNHGHVGSCRVVASQCHHDLCIGGAVPVGGFVWLLAVHTANRGVVAGVPSLAVSDCTWVTVGGVHLGAYRTGVVVGSAVLGGVPVLLALVALG